MNTSGPHRSAASLRLFYALWPDAPVRAALMRLQSAFHGRLTQYDNLHLTLAFLGRQPASLLPALSALLEDLPAGGIPLDIDRAGYFKNQGIAWAGMHAPPDALLDLQRALTDRLKRHGIAFDTRSSFKPHVTLARAASPPDDAPFEPIRWLARQVALVQSTNGPSGVVYQVLASRFLDEGGSES